MGRSCKGLKLEWSCFFFLILLYFVFFICTFFVYLLFFIILCLKKFGSFCLIVFNFRFFHLIVLYFIVSDHNLFLTSTQNGVKLVTLKFKVASVNQNCFRIHPALINTTQAVCICNFITHYYMCFLNLLTISHCFYCYFRQFPIILIFFLVFSALLVLLYIIYFDCFLTKVLFKACNTFIMVKFNFEFIKLVLSKI